MKKDWSVIYNIERNKLTRGENGEEREKQQNGDHVAKKEVE